MEKDFVSYVRWIDNRGLNRLGAFELLIDGEASSGFRFPTLSMEEQCASYMGWVEEEGLSPFYAFTATRPGRSLDRLGDARVRVGPGGGAALSAAPPGVETP